MEIGPQPHGVVRSNIYTAMKFGVQHMLDWVRFFNSGAIKHRLPTKYFCFATRPRNVTNACFDPFFGHVLSPLLLVLLLFSGTIFEGGCVDVFTMIKHIDYPRDGETRNITAAIHPQLQVQSE